MSKKMSNFAADFKLGIPWKKEICHLENCLI